MGRGIFNQDTLELRLALADSSIDSKSGASSGGGGCRDPPEPAGTSKKDVPRILYHGTSVKLYKLNLESSIAQRMEQYCNFIWTSANPLNACSYAYSSAKKDHLIASCISYNRGEKDESKPFLLIIDTKKLSRSPKGTCVSGEYTCEPNFGSFMMMYLPTDHTFNKSDLERVIDAGESVKQSTTKQLKKQIYDHLKS